MKNKQDGKLKQTNLNKSFFIYTHFSNWLNEGDQNFQIIIAIHMLSQVFLRRRFPKKTWKILSKASMIKIHFSKEPLLIY